MTTRILATLLLVCGLAFGQVAITDASTSGSPLQLSGTTASLTGANVSPKEILFYAINVGGDHTYRRDYYFKSSGILAGGTETIVNDSSTAAEIGQAKVTYVEFADGTSWGDSTTRASLIAVRPVLLGMFNQLIAEYSLGGEIGVVQLLNGLAADKSQGPNVHGMAHHYLLVDQNNGIAGVMFDLNKRVAAAAAHAGL